MPTFFCGLGGSMQLEEIANIYQISLDKLKKLEKAGLCQLICDKTTCELSLQDTNYLSELLTLFNLGFSTEKIKVYMGLQDECECSAKQQMEMLQAQRKTLLCQVHDLQKNLDQVDEILYELHVMK